MRALTAVLCLLGTEAAALSCFAHEPSHVFNRAAEAEEAYVVLLGEMDFDESALPQGVINEERTPEPVTAQFSGQQLASGGFTFPYEGTVIVQPTCAGPWCGGLRSGTPHLFFMQVIDEVPTLVADACSTWHFSEPSQDMIAQVETCVKGGACPAAPF